MNRKETTKFLTDLLIYDRLSDRKYYAKEVTLDYGTIHPKRIDVINEKNKRLRKIEPEYGYQNQKTKIAIVDGDGEVI